MTTTNERLDTARLLRSVGAGNAAVSAASPAAAAQPRSDDDYTAATARRRATQAKLLAVEYRLPGYPKGRTDTVPFREAASALDTKLWPVRPWMQYRGQWCKPGWYYFAQLGEHVSYESRFEMRHLMLLDFADDIIDVVPQPFRLHWRIEGARRRHTPDFKCLRRDRSVLCLDIKGSGYAAEADNAFVFEVTRRACAELGYEYRVATDFPVPFLTNLTWLAGYRYDRVIVEPDIEAALREIVDQPVTFDRALRETAWATGALPALVLPAMFAMVWHRNLSVDLTTVMTGRSLVAPAGHVWLPKAA